MRKKKHSGLFERQKSSIRFVLQDMEENNYSWVTRIVLFGSCAKHTNKYSSDVDILYIIGDNHSDYRDEMHHLKCVLTGLPEGEYADIDPKFMLEEYVENHQSTFLNNVKKEGIVIWTRNLT